MANKFNVEEGKWGEENIVSRRESCLYDVIGVNKFLPKKWGLFGTPLTTGLSIFILFY